MHIMASRNGSVIQKSRFSNKLDWLRDFKISLALDEQGM